MIKKKNSLLLATILCLSFVNTTTVGNIPVVLELDILVCNPTDEAMAFQLKQSWAKIGIDLSVTTLDWSYFMSSILSKCPNYQTAIVNLATNLHEPNMGTFFHVYGGLNVMGWNDNTTNDLICEALKTIYPNDRIVYNELQEHLMDQLPLIPISTTKSYSAAQADILFYTPTFASPNNHVYSLESKTGNSTMVYGQSWELVDLNPIFYRSTSSIKPITLCLDGLYAYDYNSNIVPVLAKELPIISEDGLTWTIPLREDIFWQDGERFTAKDVYFSFISYIDPENPEEYGLDGRTNSYSSGYWKQIRNNLENFVVLDEFTIQMKLYDPDLVKETWYGADYGDLIGVSPAIYLRDNLQKKIIPEHLLNVTDSNEDGYISDEDAWQEYNNGTNFIGTGPYIFNSDFWEKGEQYTLNLRTNSENPYWSGDPTTDPKNAPDVRWTEKDTFHMTKLVTKFLTIDEQLAEFEAGEVDIVYITGHYDLYEKYNNSPLFKIYSTQSGSMKFIAFYDYSLLLSHMDDRSAFRKALAYAMNKEFMVQSTLGDTAVVCENPYPVGADYYHINNPIKYQYKIEEALIQFKKAGFDTYGSITANDSIMINYEMSDPTDSTVIGGVGFEWVAMISVILTFGQINRKTRRR
ncbi:MAG: ABC transporter substrate-binding protein [Candidatus Kariarchaeaceae archaeon]